MVLPHPNGSSTRLRFCWLTSYPQWRIVRPSMAERRLVVFWATCGVTLKSHVGHKVSRIEALVGTHGDALGARRIAHDHVFRGFALDRARHLSQFRLDDEAVAVLRHDVARISELCLLTLALLGEFGFGVRGGAVRLIAALLAVKMALAVAPRRWRVTRTVLRHKALHRCPSLNLRAVDGKVVVRKQGSHLPMSEKLGQEFARHLGFEQPVAVLREHRRHPNSIIHAKTDKPAIEQIVM